MLYNKLILLKKGAVMYNKKFFSVFLTAVILIFNLNAGERTIPVDMVIMIDKSLSMEGTGKFDSLKKWVLDELVEQMLTAGDWVSVYQFYENPEHLLSVNVNTSQDKQKIVNTISSIKPDGKYTDIGKALDKMQEVMKTRNSNGRYKVLLLVTDLEQDAPWPSKYSGKQKKFSSPYLVESRIIKHDNWYEITVDMGIEERVVTTTSSLFSDIIKNAGKERTNANEKEALIKTKKP